MILCKGQLPPGIVVQDEGFDLPLPPSRAPPITNTTAVYSCPQDPLAVWG